MLSAAGVVDCFELKMSQNAASADIDLLHRDILKDLRLFLLRRLIFFIDIKIKRNL
jgi:hypothetical protein